jgi:hypothetical protein
MAATKLVREVLASASVLLNDTNPQFHRYPEADMLGFFNDGALAIATFVPTATSTALAVKLRAGARQFLEQVANGDWLRVDGASAAGALRCMQLLEVVRNLGPNGLTPGRAIALVDRDVLDLTADWPMAANAARRVSGYTFNPLMPTSFMVSPPVPSTGAAMWVEVVATVEPPKLTVTTPGEFGVGGGNATVIPVPNEWAETLTNYIVARALLVQNEWVDASKAAAFAGSFLNVLNGRAAVVTGTNPNLKRLPYAPEPVGQAS